MKQKIKSVAKSKQQSPALHNNKKLSKRITTKKEWNDLDIDRTVKQQLNGINDLISKLRTPYKFGEEKNADEKVGYKVLFAGSEKGKKLAAKLLGKQNSMDVYRIDVAGLVSKYIGETEKNLKKLFDAAKENNSILFFDEADALFGKRTNVKDAHDHYANDEISYLLQRINEYSGLIIFSSKNKDDSGNTFPIHLNAIVHFKKPS
jgi:SpoVK/Ycf46/Vps4 family AAA+-type ATPase